MKNKKLNIGSHVSLKAPDYLLGSLKESINYGANAFMIYTGAPQNTMRVPTSRFKIEEFMKELPNSNITLDNIVVHAPYIFNPANIKQKDFAIKFLAEEMRRTNAIGSHILVLHPGAHVGAGYDQGIENAAVVINEALKITSDIPVQIAIETMSGKGTEICYRFEQMKQLIDLIDDKTRAKVCMDTCHIHDAGYDIINNLDKVMEEFDTLVGIDNVIVNHINDSKNPCFGRKDRHQNIGKGYIGLETLIKFVYYPKFKDIPMILETPYIDGLPPYKEEIAEIISKG